MIVIGDVAGQFKALTALVDKFPKGEEVVLVGDLMDRGPDSNKVIEWAMTTPNVLTIGGNHEDLMVDHCRNQHRYEEGIWLMNGGGETINSYGFPLNGNVWDMKLLFKHIPEAHIAWLESLPLFIEREDVFISHAPVSMFHKLEVAKTLPLESGSSLVWNRSEPEKMEGKLQLFGHNANWKLRKFGSPDPWAICLDTSWDKVLTGYNTKTKEFYQQPYIEQEK